MSTSIKHLMALSLLEAGRLDAELGEQPVSFRPPLDLCRALLISERYAAEMGIDLSAQYVHLAMFHCDEELGTFCWRIQWMWCRPALGGEFGIKVFMDGSVREDRLDLERGAREGLRRNRRSG